MSRLYTYVPRDNTVSVDGLLSTRLVPTGWEKYRERLGGETRDEVLRALDRRNGFRRSYGISAFHEPIPEDAPKEMREFAGSHHLYSFDARSLLRRGILRRLMATDGRGSRKPKVHEVSRPSGHALPWSRGPGRFLFSRIPHYIVETADGSIPPEHVRDEELVPASR